MFSYRIVITNYIGDIRLVKSHKFIFINRKGAHYKSNAKKVMRKFLSAVLCTTLVVSMLTGCGNKAEDSSTSATKQEEAQTEAQVVDQAEEITIEHVNGTATVKKNPQKVVVFDLGVLDTMDVLGVEAEVAVPVNNLTSYLKKYESVTNAGGIKEPDIEGIFNFKPDVIFISGRQGDFYEELNKIAPTVYWEPTPETYVEDFKSQVQTIATLFGKEAEAEQKIAEIDALIEEGKEKAEASDEKALVILTNDGGISAYGKGSRFGIVHDVLGVKPADETIEVSTHGQEVGYEYISKVNPDKIFVIDRTAVVGGEKKAADTLDNDLVKSTNAGKNDNIVYLTPEVWYLGGAGLTSVKTMVEEVVNSL